MCTRQMRRLKNNTYIICMTLFRDKVIRKISLYNESCTISCALLCIAALSRNKKKVQTVNVSPLVSFIKYFINTIS